MRYELEHIAHALKEARERKGLSQRTLSHHSGVPQGQISKIENGAVDLRVSSLIAITRALDLELSLVPRKSLSAINAIINRAEREHQPAKHSREWVRLLNQVRTLINEDPERKDYAQIYRYLRDLDRFSPSIDQNFRKWFELNNIEKLRINLHDEKQSKLLVKFLQNLRNDLAHRLDDEREAEEVKPAYSLDGGDDG